MSQRELLQSIYLDVDTLLSHGHYASAKSVQSSTRFCQSCPSISTSTEIVCFYYFTHLISSNGYSLLTSHPNASTRTTIDFKDEQALRCAIYTYIFLLIAQISWALAQMPHASYHVAWFWHHVGNTRGSTLPSCSKQDELCPLDPRCRQCYQDPSGFKGPSSSRNWYVHRKFILPQATVWPSSLSGTGATAIYPLLACKSQETWRVVGTGQWNRHFHAILSLIGPLTAELDQRSYNFALQNVQQNALNDRITIRKASKDGPILFPLEDNTIV